MARFRKQNWSDADKHLLLDHIEDKYDKLFGKLSSKLTSKDKKDIWIEIAQSFSGRSPEDVRKKFIQLKSEKIREYSAYQRSIRGTGGGPPPASPDRFVQRIIGIVGEDNPKVTGIDEGMDTSYFADNNDSLDERDIDIINTTPDLETSVNTVDDCPLKRKKLKDVSVTPSNSSFAKEDGKKTSADKVFLGKMYEAEIIRQSKEIHEMKKEKLRLEIELLRRQNENEEMKKIILKAKLDKIKKNDLLPDQSSLDSNILVSDSLKYVTLN